MVTPCLHHTPAPAPLSGWLDGMILTVHRHSVTSEDVEPQCKLSGCRDSVSSYRGGQAMVLVVTEVVKTVWPVNMLPHSESCQVVEPWHEVCLVWRAIVWVVMLNHTVWVIRLWSQMWVCQVVKSNVSLSGCQALVWAVMSSHMMWVVMLSSHSMSSDVKSHNVSMSGCQAIVWAVMLIHTVWVVMLSGHIMSSDAKSHYARLSRHICEVILSQHESSEVVNP